MNIAFLGLGKMGSGMAHRLLAAGHSLRVWNRDAAKTAPLEQAGAVACPSAQMASEGTPLVISSLMDDASVRAVFGGPEGVIAGMAPGAIHLGTSTISPTCADWLAAKHADHGSRYLSGPVVGRPDAAAEGKLIQFLAGDPTAIKEVLPVCSAFATLTIPLPGPPRAANSQKLCVNFFIVSLIETMAECYTLAEKTGASREIMEQFFTGSLARPGLQQYAVKMNRRDPAEPAGFSMRGGLKDVRLMLDAAREAECPLDLARLIEAKMQRCIAAGLGDADWSEIQEPTREDAGLDSRRF
jgi:3-hydroxyisobutyrate dehydrogenase-like beta-hydroxyacid dehydrogenase